MIRSFDQNNSIKKVKYTSNPFRTHEDLGHRNTFLAVCCLMGKEIWMWKHFGTCEIENPTNRGAFSCFLNRVVDLLFSKKAIYRMLVSVQSCFNSRNTRYYNNVMATADHVTVESIRHLQPVKFGPLTVTAPDDLEGFLRYNYPTLHRFTEEEQEKVNNHYPAALSFSTTPKQEL